MTKGPRHGAGGGLGPLLPGGGHAVHPALMHAALAAQRAGWDETGRDGMEAQLLQLSQPLLTCPP